MTLASTRSRFTVSSEKSRLDVGLVHRFLSEESYWAKGISRSRVEVAIECSVCFGAYTESGSQVGFARVITDQATFAYLCDVFVVPEFRGRGVARQLVEASLREPRLQGLRRWLLATRDAHPLYAKLGFSPLSDPSRFMERWSPDAYAPG